MQALSPERTMEAIDAVDDLTTEIDETSELVTELKNQSVSVAEFNDLSKRLDEMQELGARLQDEAVRRILDELLTAIEHAQDEVEIRVGRLADVRMAEQAAQRDHDRALNTAEIRAEDVRAAGETAKKHETALDEAKEQANKQQAALENAHIEINRLEEGMADELRSLMLQEDMVMVATVEASARQGELQGSGRNSEEGNVAVESAVAERKHAEAELRKTRTAIATQRIVLSQTQTRAEELRTELRIAIRDMRVHEAGVSRARAEVARRENQLDQARKEAETLGAGLNAARENTFAAIAQLESARDNARDLEATFHNARQNPEAAMEEALAALRKRADNLLDPAPGR